MHGITLRCGARTRAFACTGRRMHTMLDMVGGLAAVHQGAQTCTASTMARVAVAMPDMRCRKLSATRSAVSRLRADPRTCARGPRPTWPLRAFTSDAPLCLTCGESSLVIGV